MIPSKKVVSYGAFVLTDESAKLNNQENQGFVMKDGFKKKSEAVTWARDQIGDIQDTVLIYGMDERGIMVINEPHGQSMDGEDFLSFA